MKTIIAVIHPAKLDAVRGALERVEVFRMTVTDALGYADTPKAGEKTIPRLARKVTLEIVVNEDFLDRAVQVIELVARTGADGQPGDGKIFVVPTLAAIAIADGYRGPGAV